MKNKHPVLRRFMRRKVSVVAAAVLILFVLIAILGPLVWQVDPLKQSVMKKYGPMTVQHPLGTDNLGRDTLARMIYGARVSLAISFAGVLSGALIGVLLGVSAGYFGGWVDAVLMRVTDIFLAFPRLILALALVAVLALVLVPLVLAQQQRIGALLSLQPRAWLWPWRGVPLGALHGSAFFGCLGHGVRLLWLLAQGELLALCRCLGP